MNNFPVLSLITFLPLFGAAMILVMVQGKDAQDIAGRSRWMALFTSGITFLISLILWIDFDRGTADFQFVERLIVNYQNTDKK